MPRGGGVLDAELVHHELLVAGEEVGGGEVAQHQVVGHRAVGDVWLQGVTHGGVAAHVVDVDAPRPQAQVVGHPLADVQVLVCSEQHTASRQREEAGLRQWEAE